jgi:predicted phage terminase large subunit-like protein
MFQRHGRSASRELVARQLWSKARHIPFRSASSARGRMDCPATIKAVKRLSEKWPKANAKLIEDNANGPAVIAMLRHEVDGPIAVNPEGGKEARAHAVSPQIEAGNVYLPHENIAPWVDAFIEECAVFPNGPHDDRSAMTQALLRLKTRAFVEIAPPVCLYRESPWRDYDSDLDRSW